MPFSLFQDCPFLQGFPRSARRVPHKRLTLQSFVELTHLPRGAIANPFGCPGERKPGNPFVDAPQASVLAYRTHPTPDSGLGCIVENGVVQLSKIRCDAFGGAGNTYLVR